jgi:hypothetical protein
MTEPMKGGAEMTIRRAQPRHPIDFRKDTEMLHIELRLQEGMERQARLRSLRDADRAASGRARSLRHQLGESLIRLGRRIAGDGLTSPAWTS